MWRVAAAFIIMSAHCSVLLGQEEHILALTGASGIEELDETVIERFEALEKHRVHINTASRQSLASCGLFTQFQAASIDDWRRRTGDILSLSELASIDGFSPHAAQHLAPYIDFSSRSGIGRPSLGGASVNEFTGRLQERKDEGDDLSSAWGFKYRYMSDSRASVSLAARDSYDSSGISPDTWSFCATLQGKRHMDKLILGDFNAHFGQGLAMWSGFSLSGAGTVEAFSKRAAGISPTWSFGTTSFRGAASSFCFGNWTFTGMAALPGLRSMMDGNGRKEVTLLPAANISWLGRRGQFGITGYAHSTGDAKASADMKWHYGQVDMYGEGALDLATGALSGIGGAIWSPRWQHRYAFMLRSYPHTYTPGQAGAIRAGSKVSDETGATIGMQLPWLSLSADAAWFPSRGSSQLKMVCTSTLRMSERLSLVPRLSFRLKDGSTRTDLRADIRWSKGPWNIIARSNCLRCEGWAWLQYIEMGRKTDRAGIWLRGTAFIIDSWDDRIYVYERDAPGSFNVPAYFGRGLAASAVCGWKWKKTKLHLRASMVHYASDKPSRVELRCQYSVSL